MDGAVVRERDPRAISGERHAIELGGGDAAAARPAGSRPRSHTAGAVVSEHDLEARPCPGYARIEDAAPLPAMRSPRMLSTPARYIHPAEPVYQVHPPRPTWGGGE